MDIIIDIIAGFIVGIICFILLAEISRAGTLEIAGPVAFTQHIINNPQVSNSYTNKVSKDGSFIVNPEIAFIATKSYDNGQYRSVAVFGGQNSVGSTMGGGIFEMGSKFTAHFSAGLALGGYAQDNLEFERRVIIPLTQIATINNVGIVPIVALALNFQVKLSDKYYMQTHTLVSPVIATTIIGVGYQW